MNFDIVSEVGKLYDLSRTIPRSTIFLIAFSGIALLCGAVALVFFVRRRLGLHFLPVLYGLSAYLLFYVFIGSLLSNLTSMMVTENSPHSVLIFARILSLMLGTGALVAGRFAALWFIRRYFSEYCDAWGVGVGVSLIDGAITGFTIFFNYCLCMTINQSGLASLAESCESVEIAVEQMKAVWVFFDNPPWFYLLSGLESLLYLAFHTMISVLYYAVYHGEMKKFHIATAFGLQTLLLLPGSLYSSGLLFNRIGCFVAESAVFAGSVYFFIRIHNRFYKDIPSAALPKRPRRGGGSGQDNRPKKMPDFNKNINKL